MDNIINRLAILGCMTYEEAQQCELAIRNRVMWTPDMIIRLSNYGFRVSNIIEKLDNDPMFLLTYLALHDQPDTD